MLIIKRLWGDICEFRRLYYKRYRASYSWLNSSIRSIHERMLLFSLYLSPIFKNPPGTLLYFCITQSVNAKHLISDISPFSFSSFIFISIFVHCFGKNRPHTLHCLLDRSGLHRTTREPSLYDRSPTRAHRVRIKSISIIILLF
jgi:hypothetical protein